MRRRKPAPSYQIGLAQCSVCDAVKVTVGDQARDGVHWCRECIVSTLGWQQLSETQRANLLELFEQFSALPGVVKLLEAAARIPPERLKAMAVGASKARAMRVAKHEMRDGW